jgi:DNA-binding Lrp family transcriptional regulator
MTAIEQYKQKQPFDPSKYTAFVFIEPDWGFEDSVLTELDKIDAVKERASVYGVYTIIARVQTLTLDELKGTVKEKIRKIGNVHSTLTNMYFGKDTEPDFHGFCRNESGGFSYINPPEDKLDESGRRWWDYVPEKKKT